VIASCLRPTRDEFRRVAARFATGVSVVTTRAADGSPHGFTANSFTSVSADPPLVLVCLGLRSSVLKHFESAPYFGVNFLSEDQQPLSVRFAAHADVRFDGVDWSPGTTLVPVLAGTLGGFECAAANRIVAGDHIMLLGEVLVARRLPGRPLLYFDSSYRQIREY
jgi:flavin reductase (DIM6/NTAB) family NADH-FMN oxidoreductase RutF